MRRNKKKNTRLALLCLLLLIGIGFAALAAKLKINGSLDVTRTEWDVHFENVQITQGSVTANPAPTSDDTTTTEIEYAVHFTKPGDFFEFTVDIANDGTINAMINLLSNGTYEADGTTERNLPSYLTSSITYIDGAELKPNQLITHGTSETIKVRVEYKSDVEASELPETADTVKFKLSSTFKQADSNATPIRFAADFSTDSWSDITVAYKSGLTTKLETAMANGTTREVQLDMDNDGTPETTAHLRIANMNAPQECSQPGFSRSACGLVLEFVETLTTRRMNPSDQGNQRIGEGAYGGWEHSEMRNYVNSVIYNALPPELKSRVVDTPLVSGYGKEETENFYTLDKIYLFSDKEIVGTYSHNGTEAEFTRQLDYYHDKEVVPSNNMTYATKRDLSGTRSSWWMRSIEPNDKHFKIILDSGEKTTYGVAVSEYLAGVSPAFRIG